MKQALEPIFPRHLFENFPEITEDITVSSIKCPICLDVCRDAIIENSCGHTFCKRCVDQLFKHSKDGSIICPQTRKPIRKDQVGPNRALRDLILQLRVNCILKDKGCNWQGRYLELDQHLKEQCVRMKLKCNNSGCTFVRRRKYADHHIKICEFKAVSCKMCNNNFVMNKLKTHQLECPCIEILCPYGCRQKVKRQDCNLHYNDICANKIVECEFKAYGCLFQTKRTRYQDHLKDNYVFHIDIMKEKIEKTRQDWSVLNNELESLKVIASTEDIRKAIQEKDIEVDTLKQEVGELRRINEGLLDKNEKLENALNSIQEQEKYSFNESIDLYDVDDTERDEVESEMSQSGKIRRVSSNKEGSKFDVQKEGWMYKKSKYLREWRKRWFVLTSTFLYTYKEEKNYAHPTEKIALRTIKKILEEQQDSGFFTIQIKQVDGNMFQLRIEDFDEKENWLMEVEKCVMNLNR